MDGFSDRGWERKPAVAMMEDDAACAVEHGTGLGEIS